MSQEPKYRPSFSAAEIAYLVYLVEQDKQEATAELAAAVASKLKLFALKMQFKLVSPAFVATPRASLDEKLGFDFLSPAEKRKKAYERCKAHPEFASAEDVSLAKAYMYENDLMTPEQREEYEKL